MSRTSPSQVRGYTPIDERSVGHPRYLSRLTGREFDVLDVFEGESFGLLLASEVGARVWPQSAKATYTAHRKLLSMQKVGLVEVAVPPNFKAPGYYRVTDLGRELYAEALAWMDERAEKELRGGHGAQGDPATPISEGHETPAPHPTSKVRA